MIDWNEVGSLLEREIPRGIAAWRKLPELIAAGRLTKGAGGWYRVKDARTVLDELGPIIKGYRISKDQKLTHVQLSKPSKLLIEFADRIAPRDRSGSA